MQMSTQIKHILCYEFGDIETIAHLNCSYIAFYVCVCARTQVCSVCVCACMCLHVCVCKLRPQNELYI